MPTTQQ